MTEQEFRNLQHGDKINGLDGLNFIVHNHYRSSPEMIVVVRTEIIYAKDHYKWHIAKKQTPLNLIAVAAGIYQVTIDKRIG